MAFVFGEEKSAKPNPKIKRTAIMKGMDAWLFRSIKSPRPMAVRLIPIEATIRGSMRSESLPAKGENKACTTGCATRITPE